MAPDLHGKVIRYADLDKVVPDRMTFLDENQVKDVDNAILNRKELMFMPVNLHETHIQDKQYEKSTYKVILFGILVDGRRVTVVLDGIKVYFDILIPKDKDPAEFMEEIMTEIKSHFYDSKYGNKAIYDPIKSEIVQAKPFKLYQETLNSYIRIYFNKSNQRTGAIKLVRGKGYETASDDNSCYYRVACRNKLTTISNWAVLKRYNITKIDSIKGPVFRVNIDDFIKYDGDIIANPLLAKDKTMELAWDIETCDLNDDDVPQPEKPSSRMFMISMTFYWYYADEPVLRVCITDMPCDPHPDYLTIVCGNEKNNIRAFAKMYKKLRPEFVIGFNDSDYDWQWLIKRAAEYPDTLMFIAECFDATIPWKQYTDADIYDPTKYNAKNPDGTYKGSFLKFKREKIKLEADSYANGASLVLPGYMTIDVRTVFRQLYPTAEKSSLSWFLAQNKLGGKNDMPYLEIFELYRNMEKMRVELKEMLKDQPLKSKNKENPDDLTTLLDIAKDLPNCAAIIKLCGEYKAKLATVADYCVVDALRCHQLMKMRSVIQDKREVATLSYTSLFDAFYRANGMKVRNLVIARGQQRGILFSNITNNGFVEEGKYPGAHVFPPKKGMKTSKLSIEERQAKYDEWKQLEPAAIEKYKEIIRERGPNMTNDEINKAELDLGIKFEQCFKEFLLEPTGRPITGLDFSSLYPSLIMTYNLSPEYIIVDAKYARELFREGKVNLHKISFQYNGRQIRGWSVRHDNKLDPNDPECRFGVYPMVLKELFDARKVLKKHLGRYSHEKEQLALLPSEEFKKPEVQQQYNEVCFNYNYYDSKQKALKVFMNTFYGETGNKKSPFFVLQIAGGITSAGKRNIKEAQRIVEEMSCDVVYGDSVSGDTPLIIKHPNGEIEIMAIEELCADWQPYEEFKLGEADRRDKQQAKVDLEIWSNDGWAKIRRVIRHKTNKRMFRVNTHIGCVDVTEDHSLIAANGEQIKPTECKIGTELMHSFPCSDHNYSRAYFDKTITYFDKCMAQKMYYTAKLLGHKYVYVESVEFDYQIQQEQKFIIHISNKPVDNPTAIKKIIELPSNCQLDDTLSSNWNYVYDIETSSGLFHGGIGELVLKNTDSLYLSAPVEVFKEADSLFYSGGITKLDYWIQLVNITFKEVVVIRDAVNQWFISDNGTGFLNMAFEEVLWPVAFLAKKKYYGVAHEEKYNLNPKGLFIRGLEVKKRGVSELLRKVCMDIMWSSVSIGNIYTLFELVESKIDQIYKTQWDFDDFIMTDMYKPKKQNVKVLTFVKRMVREGINIKPFQRFKYVIVKKYPYNYDYRGRKITLQIGDKMELHARAKENNMALDLDYYMQGSINGQLARLIVYRDEFSVEAEGNTDEDLKIAEDKVYKNASKYIEEFCSKYYTTYASKGPIYQKIFREVNAVVGAKIDAHQHDATLVKIFKSSCDADDIQGWLCRLAEAEAKKIVPKTYGEQYVVAMIEKAKEAQEEKEPSGKCDMRTIKKNQIEELHEKYMGGATSRSAVRERQFKEKYGVLMRQIQDNLDKIKKLHKAHKYIIKRVSEKIKGVLDIDNQYNNPNIEVPKYEKLNGIDKVNSALIENIANEQVSQMMNDPYFQLCMDELKKIYAGLTAIYKIKYQTLYIVEYLKDARDVAMGMITSRKSAKELAKELTNEMMNNAQK